MNCNDLKEKTEEKNELHFPIIGSNDGSSFFERSSGNNSRSNKECIENSSRRCANHHKLSISSRDVKNNVPLKNEYNKNGAKRLLSSSV